MEARMKNPLFVVPGAMDAIQVLGKVLRSAEVGISGELLSLRASQINSCSVCIDMHAKELLEEGMPAMKVMAVAAWRESPHFSDAERAALALTEAATRIADGGEVPDEVWEDAAAEFTEEQLAGIVLGIAAINFFNRINATTRQIAPA